MDEFEIKLKILINIVEEKKNLLTSIYDITENQETFLKSGSSSEEFEMFFLEMVEEKQKYIDKVLDSDKVFQRIFLEISDGFEEKASLYKELVTHLQYQIKIVTELDIKIKAVEQKSKGILEKRRIPSKTVVSKMSKDNLFTKYKENNKQ